MKTRDDALVYQETQSSDKTSKTWDLKYTDPLSALYLEFEANNCSTSNLDNFISDIITKVEIVEGSKPLYSLSQTELEALYFYKTKSPPVLMPSEWASWPQRHGVYMLFGRKLWDQAYAFDPTKYKNPQLKITWDLNAVRPYVSTTAFSPGSLKISAIAKVMEGMTSPGSFLSAKEVDAFTMAATGSHPTEMYTDFPWRLMMLRSYLQGSDIDECIDWITLNCDAGKFKPLDTRYVKQLDAEAFQKFGRMTIRHDFKRADGGILRLLLNKEPTLFLEMHEVGIADMIYAYSTWSSQSYNQNRTYANAPDSNAWRLTGLETGHGLHATVPVHFGDMDDPTTWFDATQFQRIDLTCHAGGQLGVSSVVLEQVRPNGS